MNLTQRVLYNTVTQIAGKAVLLLSMLVTIRLTTTYLDADRFGEYSIVLAFTPIILVVSDLGISTLFARELARAPERRDELGGTLLVVRLVTVVAVLLLYLAVVPFLPYDYDVRVGMVIAALGALSLSIGSFAMPFFQVSLRLDLIALVDLVTAALTVTLIALVTQLDLGFYALIGAGVVASLANLGLALLLSARFWRPNLRLDVALAKGLLRDALPIGLVIVLGLVHFRIDSVLLSLLKPPLDVGIYGVAYRFLDVSLIIPVVFMAAAFPILSSVLHGDEELAQEVIEKSFNFLLLIAVPLAIGVAYLAEPLVELIAPRAEFQESIEPLRILAPTMVFTFAATTFSSLLIALNRQWLLVGATGLAATSTVVVNLVLIPHYSYTGAAVTTVVTEAAGFCVVFVLAKRVYAFRLHLGFLLRLGAAAAALGAVLFALAAYPPWLAVLAGGAVFTVAAHFLRVVSRADLRLVLGR